MSTMSRRGRAAPRLMGWREVPVPGIVPVDWDLPDPKGRSIDEVRAVRDEVRRRVAELIDARGRRPRDGSLRRALRMGGRRRVCWAGRMPMMEDLRARRCEPVMPGRRSPDEIARLAAPAGMEHGG